MKNRARSVLFHKKAIIWIVSICIMLVAVIFLNSQIKKEENADYLNPNALQQKISELDKVKVLEYERSGYTYLTGKYLSKWISETKWQEKQVSSAYELMSTYRIEGLLGNQVRSEIELYESEPTLVKIIYEKEWRYYTINKSAYKDISFIIETRSYFMPFEK